MLITNFVIVVVTVCNNVVAIRRPGKTQHMNIVSLWRSVNVSLILSPHVARVQSVDDDNSAPAIETTKREGEKRATKGTIKVEMLETPLVCQTNSL